MTRLFRDAIQLCSCWALIVVAIVIFSSVFSVAQANTQATFSQALQLLQNGDSAGALAMLNAVLEAGSRDPAIYNLKGLAASNLERNGEAEESFRTVIRLSPQSSLGYVNLGVLLSKLGRNQQAADSFREGVRRDPKNFTALMGLGTSLASLHQYGAAAKSLQQAWDIHPTDFQAGYQLALALREAKLPAAAKRVIAKVNPPADLELDAKYYSLAGVVAEELSEFTEAQKFYRRAYELTPESYEVYFALARASVLARAPAGANLPAPPPKLSMKQNLALGALFFSSGNYKQAVAAYQAVLQQDPANETAATNLAVSYKNLDESTMAIDLVKRTIEVHPSAALCNLLGGLDEESGQYLDAVQNFQHAVEMDPSSEEYYFDLGMEYLSHFTFGPAADVFRVGTQKFPQSSRQFLGLAFSHYAVREYKEAAEAFMRALEIDPKSPTVFQAWKTMLSFLGPKDWAAMLPRLNRLSAAFPQSAELSFAYGAALFRSELARGSQGSLDKPQALLEKSLRLKPDFPEAHLELGTLYAARKLDQKAVEEYQETISQDPKSDVAHYKLGQAYREMNKMDLASQELARYQDLSRTHEEELKHSRSAIQQFVLSKPPGASPAKTAQ